MHYRLIYIPFILLCISLISGCAIKYMDMNPEPLNNQKFIYDNGKKVVISQQKHYVSLAAFHNLNVANTKTSYSLSIQNLGQEPITFGTDNVCVLFFPTNGKGKTQVVRIQSYDELMREVDEYEAKQKGWAAFSYSVDEMNIKSKATTTTTTNTYGTVQGQYSGYSSGMYANNPYSMNTTGNVSGSYDGVSKSTTYDPAKAEVLAKQYEEEYRNKLNEISTYTNSIRQQIESLSMRTQTIMPGQSHYGVVTTDTRNMNCRIEGYFEITISVDDDVHTFKVNRTLHQD